MISWFAIFIGGGLGSLFRYGISKWVITFSESQFPLATLISNILSCIAMGAGLALIIPRMEGNEWLKPFLLIGFCGGFSTFSTFSLETLQLLKTGNHMFAIVNVLVSVALCVTILSLLIRNT